MVSRIRREADDAFGADERERKSYYGAQYQEKAESMQRLEAAMARRSKALSELRATLEVRDFE